jgi:hypothetical protein
MKNYYLNLMLKVVATFTIAALISCSEAPKNFEENRGNEVIQTEAAVTESKEKVTTEMDSKVNELSEGDNQMSNVEELIEEQKVMEDQTMVEEVPPSLKDEIKKQNEEVVSEVTLVGIDHSIWDELLKKNVSATGKVNYKGFKADKKELENYLSLLKSNSPSSNWSRNEKLAYWINVYNAFTVKLIVDNYPLKSITDLDKPWDKKLIEIDGKSYSLGEVENNILRKMGESRIHFAINCASFSCPQLLNEAFTADKLETQLRDVTKSFLNDQTKNDLTDGHLKVSKLFEWYAADFSNGNIIAYINKHSSKTFKTDSKISYLEYNWNLNE